MRLLFDVCMVHTKVFKSLTLVVHMSHWMLLDTVLVWKDGPGRWLFLSELFTGESLTCKGEWCLWLVTWLHASLSNCWLTTKSPGVGQGVGKVLCCAEWSAEERLLCFRSDPAEGTSGLWHLVQDRHTLHCSVYVCSSSKWEMWQGVGAREKRRGPAGTQLCCPAHQVMQQITQTAWFLVCVKI